MIDAMGSELWAEASRQGLWAILYITLFIYTLKESRRQEMDAREREARIQTEFHEFREDCRKRELTLTNFINDITRQYERLAIAVEKMSYDVDDIKAELKIARKHLKGGEVNNE